MFVIGILILCERVQTSANVACRSLSACDLCVSFPVSICGPVIPSILVPFKRVCVIFPVRWCINAANRYKERVVQSKQKKKKNNKATFAKDQMNANICKKLRLIIIKVQSIATLFIAELLPEQIIYLQQSAPNPGFNTNLSEPHLVKRAQMRSLHTHPGLPSCSTLQGDKWPRLAFSTTAQRSPPSPPTHSDKGPINN